MILGCFPDHEVDSFEFFSLKVLSFFHLLEYRCELFVRFPNRAGLNQCPQKLALCWFFFHEQPSCIEYEELLQVLQARNIKFVPFQDISRLKTQEKQAGSAESMHLSCAIHILSASTKLLRFGKG